MINKEQNLKIIFAALLTITALLIVILIFILPEKPDKSILYPLAPETDSEKIIEKPVKESVPDKETKAVIKKEKKLYFIIDDAGYSIENLKPFLKFPGKITIAVLPKLENSKESAQLINKHGKQVFLHQPMEAVGKNNPGPGAILKSMNEKEITAILNININSTPHIKGVNNHMGSAVTSDPVIMETIIKTIDKQGLFFTDSLTTVNSKCKEVAQKLNITIAQRDIFLDNIDNRKAIMESIISGQNIAENRGYAVMIGHVWSSELADTMMEIYPHLIEEGFTLEEMSDLILGDM